MSNYFIRNQNNPDAFKFQSWAVWKILGHHDYEARTPDFFDKNFNAEINDARKYLTEPAKANADKNQKYFKTLNYVGFISNSR